MAITDFSGLTINAPQVGIQISKVTDSSADWSGVASSTYFYDKADKLVHYKDSTGVILELFANGGGGNTASTLQHNVKYAEAINKGQAVYVSSADGTNIVVSKADYSTEGTSSKTMGLVLATGALNYQGIVVTEGLLVVLLYILLLQQLVIQFG